jgi:hypothetical protein
LNGVWYVAGLTDPCDIAYAATKCVHDADAEVSPSVERLCLCTGDIKCKNIG